MKPLRCNQFMADRGARLGGFPSCPPPPPGGQVRTAPVVPPPATGAGVLFRSARQTGPGRSAPAESASDEISASAFQAKASEDNGATVLQDEMREAADSMAGEVSRVDAGRTASATSEVMDVTAGETAPNSACLGSPDPAARETAPVASPTPAGAVALSDASAFILSLVAAHEGRRAEDVLAQLIAAAAEAIGIHSLIMRDAGEVDLADLPDFALRAANRFRAEPR